MGGYRWVGGPPSLPARGRSGVNVSQVSESRPEAPRLLGKPASQDLNHPPGRLPLGGGRYLFFWQQQLQRRLLSGNPWGRNLRRGFAAGIVAATMVRIPHSKKRRPAHGVRAQVCSRFRVYEDCLTSAVMADTVCRARSTPGALGGTPVLSPSHGAETGRFCPSRGKCYWGDFEMTQNRHRLISAQALTENIPSFDSRLFWLSGLQSVF